MWRNPQEETWIFDWSPGSIGIDRGDYRSHVHEWNNIQNP
jgi:hypothetical protein